MRRRALRPSFVVTFALGATALASACNGGLVSSNAPVPSPDGGSGGDAGCPAEPPAANAPCDLPSSIGACNYGSCSGTMGPTTAYCQAGTWVLGAGGCNPPAPVYEAGPDVEDAALSCSGYMIPYCDGEGGISTWCCPMGADCDSGPYCDLGGGACSVGACRDAATPDGGPDGEGQDGGHD